MNKDISISRNEFLSNNKMRDCYYIISASNGMLAYDFYNRAEHDVNHNGHILFTAETPQMVVGFIKGRVFNMPDAALAEIEYFYIDAKYRHRGIGQALLAAYEEHVRSHHNAQGVRLHSAPAIHTLNFYKSSGYRITGAQYLMTKDFTR